jgi:hypothetical protein
VEKSTAPPLLKNGNKQNPKNCRGIYFLNA